MNILDDPEEYVKLMSSFGIPKEDTELNELSNKLNNHSISLEKLSESHESHKNDIDSRMSQICIDIEMQKKDLEIQKKDLSDSLLLEKEKCEALSNELNELKEYRQNMEEYKKVTNERIEKLIKLFLSINNK